MSVKELIEELSKAKPTDIAIVTGEFQEEEVRAEIFNVVRYQGRVEIVVE